MKKLPEAILNVVRRRKNKDGSETLYVTYNSKIIHPIIRKVYGVKRVDKELFRKVCHDGISNYLKERKTEKIEKILIKWGITQQLGFAHKLANAINKAI